MGIRFASVIAIFTLTYGFLAFQLYRIQIINNEDYSSRAESQYAASGYLNAPRGSIYFLDKDGREILAAFNKDFPVIFAVPKEVEDYQETSHILASVLDIPVEDLLAKLSNSEDPYEPILKKPSNDLAKAVDKLNLKGVYVDKESYRFYPFNTRMSQTLGFVAPNQESDIEIGRYGLESFYQDTLAGKLGKTSEGKTIPPQEGEDIYLTIDPNIQIESEKILSNLVSKYKAKAGSIIVQDPKTGKILAMESLPNFNPNSYGQYELGTYLNPSVQARYEPGSVFKVITMAVGIDSGRITPDTTFIDKGELRISGRTIKNWDLKAHGRVTMTNVLEHSINTGAAFAESQIGHSLFKQYLEKFGFSERTGIDLPGEVSGDLRPLQENAPDIAFATASYGQGVAVTQIEMINAFSAIANGGRLMRPYLNSNLKPVEIRRVISPEAAKTIAEMMVSAVDEAKVAKINGYTIAGKTGTAQVPDLEKGGYTDKVINTYIGFGPTSDAQFTILVRLDEPEGAPLAGATVVPAFRKLAQFILNYYNITPDRL